MRRDMMSKLLCAVFLPLGLTGVACALDFINGPQAESPPKSSPKPGSTSWLNGWIRGLKSSDEKTPATAARKDTKPAREEKLSGPPLEERMARERARAQADYLRQLEACVRLKEIAEETKDERLRHKADTLEERCQAQYQTRLQRAAASAANHDLDEELIDKNLKSKPMLRGSRPLTEQEKNGSRPGRTAAREER